VVILHDNCSYRDVLCMKRSVKYEGNDISEEVISGGRSFNTAGAA
jgi:hypothetical protein